MLTEDDTYGDYHFPKGTVFFANTWSVHRDELEYEDPDEFRPERFTRSKFGTRHDQEIVDESRRTTYGKCRKLKSFERRK